MTNQEAFDKMVAHLRSMPGRSVYGCGVCCYNGAKCAIGVLFTDEEQERYGAYAGSVGSLLTYMSVDGHSSALHTLYESFLRDMQVVHDVRSNWGQDGFDGEARLVGIASDYGLIYTPPS